MKSRTFAFAIAMCTSAFGATVDTPTTHTLTIEVAREVVDSALVYATTHEAPGGAVAVVDAGGHLVAFARLDGSFAAASEVSLGKARTAVLFRKPTRVLEETINKGRVSMTTLPAVTGFTPLQGGVPLVIAGDIVGAVGVSGAASAAQDDEIAQAAADALAKRTRALSSATHVEGKRVDAAFTSGASIIETDAYKVNASRRDAPGEAEIHAADTDIFYVLGGAATLVTGGALVDPRSTGPNERRGTAIEGGTSTELAEGDVMVVPRGVPHWFKSVSAPLTYYVVKTSR